MIVLPILMGISWNIYSNSYVTIDNYRNSSSTHMFFADFEANEIALCKNLRRHHVGQVCGQILVLDAEVDEELQNAGVPPWKRLMGGKIISLSVCNILILIHL